MRLTRTTVTKVAVTLAAYRGVDPTNPVLAVSGAVSRARPPRTPPLGAELRRPAPGGSPTGPTRTGHDPVDRAGRRDRARHHVRHGQRAIDTLLTDPDAAADGRDAREHRRPGRHGQRDGHCHGDMWTMLLDPPLSAPGQRAARRAVHPRVHGLTCTFDGTTSSDAEDSIAAYAWDFGDGEQRGPGRQSTPTPSRHLRREADRDRRRRRHRHGRAQTVTSGRAAAAPISFVGQATSNVNASASPSGAVRVSGRRRAAAVRRAGHDHASTGPGAGWTQIGRVTRRRRRTTVWRKVATGGDAGSTVQLASGDDHIKVALTLAAYRGTDATDPVRRIVRRRGAGDDGTSHTTPVGGQRAPKVPGGCRTGRTRTARPPRAGPRPAGRDARATTARERRRSGRQPAHRLRRRPHRRISGNDTGGLRGPTDAAASTATAGRSCCAPLPDRALSDGRA